MTEPTIPAPAGIDPTKLSIQEFYEHACQTPSDIHEHLPLLRRLAENCVATGRTATREPSGGHVTELGLRWGNGSTLAFLAAAPAQLVSWDLEPLHVVHDNILVVANAVTHGIWGDRPRTRFQPRTGNTLEVATEDTDLIFFDTFHTAKHLLAELMKHGPKARKYLVFHDTKTYGLVGEDGKYPGLRAAINRFQKEYFPLWRMIEDRDNCNGLVVLQKEADYEKHPWRSFWTTGEGTPDSRPEGV